MAEETATEVEQTTDDAEREALIAAVREAGGVESVDVAAEAAAAGEKKPGAEAEKPADDPDEPKVAALLRAREKAWQERQEAESYAAQRRREADEEAAKLLSEAKQRAEREHQEYLAEQRRRFQESPTETVRALSGGDPQKMVDAVIREGSPEGRAIQELQKEVAEAKKAGADAADLKKQLADVKAEIQREKHEALVTQIRTEFFRENATKEKAPYLHARYDEEEIFTKANALGREWQEKGLKFGVDFDRDDVVTMLERESKKRYSSLVAPQQVSGAGAVEAPGKRPQGSANGSRTLSAASGSERRTTPKPLSEMTEADQRQALIDEVAAVRRTLKDHTP